MAKKLTVVSKTITSMTEPWCDTTAGTCHDFLDVEEFLKAKLNETSTSLSSKADTTAINDLETTLNNKLANKADLSAVSSAISNKADKSAVTALENTVSQKANSSDVTTALAKKADSSDVASALAKKADVSALDLKANKSDVISREELDTKADKSEVISKTDLALKADKAEVEEALATKAGIFYNDEEGSRVLVFADEASKDAYLANTSNVDLILGVINASTGSGSGGGGGNSSGDDSAAKYASLIAAWKTNPGCDVDSTTGYLTMSILMDGVDYGFKDITISEAALMLQRQGRGGNWNGLCFQISRINLPPINYFNPLVTSTNLFCSYNSSIQTLVCARAANNNVNIGSLDHIGSNCTNLRAIIGRINGLNGTMPNAPKLEEIRIASFSGSQGGIPDSPLLSYKSVEFFVTNHGGRSLTFTVHADVYAKLTGDTTSAACAALSEEERSQWTALLTTAKSKNITFTTP